MAREIVKALVAGLVGFALGCALIHAASRQSLAVMRPSIDMAYTPQAAQSKFLQPAVATQVKGRREVMDGFALAFAAALAHDKAALAVTPVDLKDDRAAKKAGYDITYEARDLDLPQNVRDGLTQARGSTVETKKRVAESAKRIEGVLADIKVAYWTDAGQSLRRQVGTLRFDLNTLGVPKAASKKLFAEVESLDLAIREKKMVVALKEYDDVKKELDSILKTL